MPIRRLCPLCVFMCLTIVSPGICEAQALAAQDATTVWNAVEQAPFDTSKTAHVENVTLTRDRIRITLRDGTIQFAAPANGMVFGAAFEGSGRIEITPPNAAEAGQLELFTKQRTLNLTFSEATFSFTDGTFDEVAKQVKWTNAGDSSLVQLYQDRQRMREDLAAQIVPRIFEGVLSSDHTKTAYFAADLKTNGAGWILATYDALKLEEVTVGRYQSRGTPAFFFDTWMSFPAGDANATQLDENPLVKDAFLARQYDIDATANGTNFSATTKMGLQYQLTGARVLVFEFDAHLRVSSVKDESGAALAFFQAPESNDRYLTHGDYLAVVLPQPATRGKGATLTFAYGGKHLIVNVGAGNFFCPSYGWYPTTADEFATREDFDMTFHTPKKFELVATGDKTGESTDGKMLVTKWKSPRPQAVAGFAFGDYKVFTDKVGNIDVEAYGNRNPDDYLASVQTMADGALPGETPGAMPAMGSLNPASMLKTTGIEIGNDLRVFQSYFGPFPFDRIAVTNIPYTYGQGWPMLLYLSVFSFMDETQRHEFGVVDQVGISDFFRAHEVSHQWWGHEVGWKTYHDQWLSEGFAQFSGNLYVQLRDGQKEFVNRLHIDRDRILSTNNFGHRYGDLGSVWMGNRLASSVAPEGYNVVVYDKGGYVLEMLRAMLEDPRNQDPDAAFKAMMQDFTKTFSGEAASTEDFKTIVERHMTPAMDLDHNQRMDWFFNEYVYGTGIAQYHLDYTASADNNEWLVSGTVTQSGVPEGWEDLIPIYVHVQGKTIRAGLLMTRGRTSPFKFKMPMKPDKISLNDDAEILALIK